MNSENATFNNIWFPFTHYQDLLNYPPQIIERGEGMYIYTKDGVRLCDAIGSWWVSILGHNHPFVSAAVKEQLDKIEHVIMAGFIAEPTLALAGLLFPLLPPP
jgi:adenosylmethionine-8-amino-7-oxononanoate aminotransferase